MKRIVPLLRELERQGYEGKLTNAAELCEQVGKEFDCIRNFLAAYYQDTRSKSRSPNLTMKKILIIEDDQIVANVYRNKFTVEGFQVEIALDGEAGLELVKSSGLMPWCST